MKISRIHVYNIVEAIHGARSPLSSWDKGDSYVDENNNDVLGPKDLTLAKKLIRGGAEHRKFLRQIMVSLTITAPVFWWSQMDTYKIGTTRNSTSFMHTGTKRNLTVDDFEKGTDTESIDIVNRKLEEYRENKSNELFESIRATLPMGYLCTSAVTMNYENVLNILHQRSYHRLEEWKVFCNELRTLPYIKEFEEAMKG